MSEFKSWSKLSLSGDIPTLENISAYFQDIMLGLEENNYGACVGAGNWSKTTDAGQLNSVNPAGNSLDSRDGHLGIHRFHTLPC